MTVAVQACVSWFYFFTGFCTVADTLRLQQTRIIFSFSQLLLLDPAMICAPMPSQSLHLSQHELGTSRGGVNSSEIFFFLYLYFICTVSISIDALLNSTGLSLSFPRITARGRCMQRPNCAICSKKEQKFRNETRGPSSNWASNWSRRVVEQIVVCRILVEQKILVCINCIMHTLYA